MLWKRISQAGCTEEGEAGQGPFMSPPPTPKWQSSCQEARGPACGFSCGGGRRRGRARLHRPCSAASSLALPASRSQCAACPGLEVATWRAAPRAVRRHQRSPKPPRGLLPGLPAAAADPHLQISPSCPQTPLPCCVRRPRMPPPVSPLPLLIPSGSVLSPGGSWWHVQKTSLTCGAGKATEGVQPTLQERLSAHSLAL